MMWTQTLLLLASFEIVVSEITVGGFDRTVSEGVKSLGYSIIYGEADMMSVNRVVKDTDKKQRLKLKNNISSGTPRLLTQDVKCLMSSDSYCTKDMYQMKRILFQSIKNDCAKCSAKEKDRAGKIASSMMVHDPAAWKMFLTRCALLTLVESKSSQQEEEPDVDLTRFRPLGSPEEIKSNISRFLAPGASVRVKRYKVQDY